MFLYRFIPSDRTQNPGKQRLAYNILMRYVADLIGDGFIPMGIKLSILNEDENLKTHEPR